MRRRRVRAPRPHGGEGRRVGALGGRRVVSVRVRAVARVKVVGCHGNAVETQDVGPVACAGADLHDARDAGDLADDFDRLGGGDAPREETTRGRHHGADVEHGGCGEPRIFARARRCRRRGRGGVHLRGTKRRSHELKHRPHPVAVQPRVLVGVGRHGGNVVSPRLSLEKSHFLNALTESTVSSPTSFDPLFMNAPRRTAATGMGFVDV